MGRGGAKYDNYTALVLLSAVSRASAGLWDVDIDLDPAPAPEDGPPFSFHATRDRSLLPYQIIGVVGAYIACVFILGSLLLTVGRRARKRAQDMTRRPVEMVKPDWNQTPVEGRNGWWQRARNKTGSIRSARSNINIASPSGHSITSFDHEMHEQNKQRDKLKLADLYGAVYGDEERKNSSVTDMHAPEPPRYERGQPLAPLAIDRPDLRRVQTSDTYPQSPLSPATPRSPSVRAIYPPNMTSTVGNEFPAAPTSPGPGLPRSPRDGRTASFGSHKSASSPQKNRKGLRDLKISNPVQRYRGDENDDGAMTPLSPRAFEQPGEVPPLTGRTNDSQYPPTTPGTGRSFPYPEDPRDEIRALPEAYPQRQHNYEYNNAAQAVTDVASTRPDPTGTLPQNRRGHGPVAGDLPLRGFARQQPAVQQEPFPLSPTGNWQTGMRSPSLKSPAIRENVLEFGSQNLTVPLTGQLTGKAVPYSPYMPDGLITPVYLPKLLGPAERKQKEREAKATRGAATDKDQVADEKDLWSSGY